MFGMNPGFTPPIPQAGLLEQLLAQKAVGAPPAGGLGGFPGMPPGGPPPQFGADLGGGGEDLPVKGPGYAQMQPPQPIPGPPLKPGPPPMLNGPGPGGPPPAQSPPPGPPPGPPGGMQPTANPGFGSVAGQALQQALGSTFGKKKQPGAGKGVRRRFSAQSPGMPNGGYGQYQPKQQPNPMG